MPHMDDHKLSISLVAIFIHHLFIYEMSVCVLYEIWFFYFPSFIGLPSPNGFPPLKGHCIEFKYYADGTRSGLTPPG